MNRWYRQGESLSDERETQKKKKKTGSIAWSSDYKSPATSANTAAPRIEAPVTFMLTAAPWNSTGALGLGPDTLLLTGRPGITGVGTTGTADTAVLEKRGT
jgi:hypothetical protein